MDAALTVVSCMRAEVLAPPPDVPYRLPLGAMVSARTSRMSRCWSKVRWTGVAVAARKPCAGHAPHERVVSRELGQRRRHPAGGERKGKCRTFSMVWRRDTSLTDLDTLPEPDGLAAEIMNTLEAGLNSFRAVRGSLEQVA